MKRVHALVWDANYGQALVRLWILAGERIGGTLALNEWERGRDEGAFKTRVTSFVEALERENPPALVEMQSEPLAFVQALDRFYALLQSTKPFVQLPYSEDDKDYWLVPVELSARQTVPLARQTGNPEAWFIWHAIIPVRTSHNLNVSVTTARAQLADAFRNVDVEQGVAMPIWIGHLHDGCRIKLEPSGVDRFKAVSVGPAEARTKSIRTSLQNAASAGALLLVLPELTVDIEARTTVAVWLQEHPEHPFEMVIAGSFHEQTVDGWYNTAELWNRHAEVVIKHRKIRLFGDADGIAEDVQTGDGVSVLVTPAGTFTLLICKDFLDEHQSVATLLQEVPVDWVIVPSYGNETTVARLKARADIVARVSPGASCAVANQRNIEEKNGTPLPGFAHASGGAASVDALTQGSLITLIVPRTDPTGIAPVDRTLRVLR